MMYFRAKDALRILLMKYKFPQIMGDKCLSIQVKVTYSYHGEDIFDITIIEPQETHVFSIILKHDTGLETAENIVAENILSQILEEGPHEWLDYIRKEKQPYLGQI